jgi:hypothetical protein
VTAIRALADDDSGYANSDRALMARIGQVVGYSVLMTTGLAIWCTPTASLMNVRDGDYDSGGALLAFAGSVQLLWMIVVLIALPLTRTTAPANGAATDRGAVPAAALRTRVVLPDMVALDTLAQDGRSRAGGALGGQTPESHPRGRAPQA